MWSIKREAPIFNWLLNPAIFNYIILTLYILSAIRWGIARDWNSSIYWLGAFIITSAVTWRTGH